MRRVSCYLTLVSIFMLSFIPLYSMHPIPADATANAGPDDNVCEGYSYDIMLATATNYASLWWSSSGNGSFNDATLLHPTYTPGIGEFGPVMLTLTAYAIAPGLDASDEMILTIHDGPEANFTMSPGDSVCRGEEITFYGTSTTPIVSWHWDFGDGTLSVVQNPTHTYMASGFYDVSLIVLNTDACNDTVTYTIQVFELPTCDFTSSPNDTAYINESITFTGMAFTLILSWDWNFDDGFTGTGQVVNHTYFNPGIYAVSLIVYNENSCRDTIIKQIVVIDPLIDFIMSPSPSCEGDTISFTGIGGSGPGDYNWDFGDGNTATGENVTHTYSNGDTYTVELTFGPEHVQHNLVVNSQASADAGPDDFFCSNESYLLSGIATDYSSLEWSSSGDGSFDDPSLINATYYPGPGDISSGTAILTLTAYGLMPCTNAMDDMTLTIYPGPLADAGPDTASCDGAPVMLNGYVENQSSNLWSTTGDGSFDDPGLLNASYIAGTNDMSNGSVVLTLTATAISPCTADESNDMLLNLPLQPTVGAGDDDMTCGIEAYTLAGSASNYSSIVWTSSGDGSFDDPSLPDATYTPGSGDIINGSASLTITALAIQPCTDATDEMLLSILASPTANAGDDDGICQGETYTLSGTASDYNEISWNTNGDGSFDDPNIFDPTYSPGPTDIVNREATLTLTATAIAPCTLGMVDAMQLGIDPVVGNPTTPVGPTTVDSYLNPTSEYEIEVTPEANGYKWSLSPSTAGDVDGTDIAGLVTWNASFQGFAYVKVTAYNSCTEITSDSLEIEVTTSVGFADHDLKELKVKIMPNPSKGIFKVEIKGIQQKLGLIIYDSYGSIVKQTSIGTIGHHEQSLDLNHLPKGMYILKLYGTNVIHKEKIIIR